MTEKLDFGCSHEMKDNIFNRDVILIKINNQIYCFTVAYINFLINDEPFYITQLSDNKETLFKGNDLTFIIKKRQSDKQQQVLLLKNNISVKYDFISAFKSGKNTFELTNPTEVKLFRNRRVFSFPTILYNSNPIRRKDLIGSQIVELQFQDEYTMIKDENIPEVKTDEVKTDEDPRLKVCKNPENIIGDKFVFDENIIMMFIEGNESVVFCYSLKELSDIFQSPFYNEGIKKELSDEKRTIVYLLYHFNKWIDIEMLENLILNEKANTFMLKFKDGILKGNQIKYLEPVVVSRKKIYPNDDFPNQFTSTVDIGEIQYKDEGNIRYRKRTFYYPDEIKEINKIHSIEWIKYEKNNPGKYQRTNYNNEPAFQKFDEKSNLIEQQFVYDNNSSTSIFYENGKKKEQESFINGKLNSIDDKPARIMFLTNGKHKIEEWYENGLRSRKNDNPSYINYYMNGKPKEEKWFNGANLNRGNDLPAIIKKYENGIIEEKYWYENGKPYRSNNLPIHVSYFKNGSKRNETWNRENEREDDLPNEITYYENGKVKEEKWYMNNKLGRKNGKPSVIEYYENGKKKSEEWYEDDVLNRSLEPNLPTRILYFESGCKKEEQWVFNDILDRDNGPAKIGYYDCQNKKGDEKEEEKIQKKYEEWYSLGEKMRSDDLPHRTEYDEEGHILKDMWFQSEDKQGREGDLPAHIEYYTNSKPGVRGSVKYKLWMIEGEPFRENSDGVSIPYDIEFNEDGSINENISDFSNNVKDFND